MAPTNAHEVANYILCLAREEEDLITNKKMQKLVYYAQAWFLAYFDEPLFGDEIQAWLYGPVQPDLYHRFKNYGWNPIAEDVVCPTFADRRIEPHIKEVMEVYGDCTAHYLSRLTHQEDPWRLTYEDQSGGECHKSISWELMRDYYRKLGASE